MYKRILVATDGSTLSKEATQSAIELAAMSQAELVVVKVVPRYPTSYFEGGVSISAKDVERIEREWTEAAQAVTDKVVANAQASGVKARGMTVRSDIVADALISTAKKVKSDLIVMASHGRRGLKRVLLGSETQHVLTHSSTPVLVLR